MIMKRIILMLSAAVLMLACGPKYEKPTQGSDLGFALSFFKEVNRTEGSKANVIVSPYSAGVVLSMLEEGAEGTTKEEFAEALNGCLFKPQDFSSDPDVTVKTANSVWVDDDFSIRNRYVSLLENDFDAFITSLSFSDPATVKAINNWCSENTEGKITGIIDKLTSADVMVLVNALYFNAPWGKAFNEENTRKDTFFGADGEKEVDMMYLKSDFLYAEYQGCQMIQLPYEGDRYVMYVMLPPEGMDVNAMIPYINETSFKAAVDMLAVKTVRLSMPKYKLETSMVLNQTLMNMGIRTAFSSGADFKAISEMGPLQLSLVKQKCYIDVSEKGTEAAAVTSAQVRLTAVKPEVFKIMNVNRPFVFCIMDTQSDSMLFAGKIVKL